MTLKIAWDAGHGYNTPGKRTPDGEREWTFNDKVGRAFANEMAQYDGVELKRFDDATGKTDVALKARTDGANAWKADYFISFHQNALSGKWGAHGGVETFIYTNPNAKSVALANAVQAAQVGAWGLRNRGVKRANLHIVREAKMPAILIEGGFMDSTTDIIKLRDDNVLKSVGIAIAKAVATHLKLTRKQAVKPTPVTPTKESEGIELNDTAREEARDAIKRAVADGTFTSKHENVDKYDDKDLLSYALVALIRKTK